MPNTMNTDHKWYMLRCTAGFENEICLRFRNKGVEAFNPAITNSSTITGNAVESQQTNIRSIVLAYGSIEQLKEIVHEIRLERTVSLTFYYYLFKDGRKEYLVVPQRKINSLVRICKAEAKDQQLDNFVVEKFKKGRFATVIEGPFKGVEGFVAHYKRQQRVGFVIGNLFTVTTAYIPTAHLKVSESSASST